MNKSLGDGSASFASSDRPLDVIPTGSLALDVALGIGGWPRGHVCGVFGPRDIGKSSIIGLNAIASAQQLGLNCAIIAVEPGFDPEWARKHGVDPDNLIIVRPDTGEESFNALYDLVTSGIIDLVIYDSIGAILNRSEIEGTDSSDAKMKMGGRANLITWGIHRIMTATYKNNVSVILLNQIRDIMSSYGPGGYAQPGGHALEHNEAIIVQLKNGKDRINAKVDDEDVEIGREIVPVVVRNKLSEGSRQSAHIMFYGKEVEGYPFGIDRVFDIVSVAIRFGLIESPSKGRYTINDQKFHGHKAIGEYLMSQPKVVDDIRKKVLERMAENGKK